MKAKVNIRIIKKVAFIFAFCLVVSFASLFCFVGSDKFIVRSDFVSFMTGAKVVSEGKGKGLYDLGIQKKYQHEFSKGAMSLLPFRNPPLLALLFTPFSKMSIFTAYWAYTFLMFFTTVFISWLSTKIFLNIKDSYWFLLPFVFYPSFIAIFAGQVSTLLLFDFVLIYLFLKKERSFLTGVLAGLLFLKPQYVVAFPFIFFLVRNKSVFVEGAVVSAFIIFFASFLISGEGFVRNLIGLLIQTENPLYGTKDSSMFTLFSSLAQVTPFSRLTIFLLNLTFYIISILFFIKNYKNYTQEINFTVLVLLTLVFCVHGSIVDMALLLIPVWILIDVYKQSNMGCNILFVIFVCIFSSLFFVLSLSSVIPILFLISAVLLYKKSVCCSYFNRSGK